MARLKKSRHQNKYFKPSDKKLDSQPLEVSIERFSDDGRGVAIVKGRATFIDHVIPGEIAKIKLTEHRKNFNQAVLLKLIESSEHRVEPGCAYYQICGGCQLQHINYNQQLTLKVEQWRYPLIKLQQAMDLPEIQFLPAIESDAFNYRLRVRLALDIKKGELGFKKIKSHKLVAIDQCSLLDKKLNDFLSELKDCLKKLPAPRKFVECLVSADSNALTLIFYINENLNEQELAIFTQFIHTKPFFIGIARQDKPYELLMKAQEPPMLNYSVDDLNIHYSMTDFTQVNQRVNEAMIQQLIEVMDFQSSDKVLDLFSGIGNISLPIAKRVASLTAYELIDTMVLKFKYNADLNKLSNINAIASDLNTANIKFEGFDKVVLDPPRAGAEHCCQLLADYVKASGQKPLVAYISCNPQTQIRDIKPLLEAGYIIDQAIPMDMFAQTAHLESLLVLKPTS